MYESKSYLQIEGNEEIFEMVEDLNNLIIKRDEKNDKKKNDKSGFYHSKEYCLSIYHNNIKFKDEYFNRIEIDKENKRLNFIKIDNDNKLIVYTISFEEILEYLTRLEYVYGTQEISINYKYFN